MGRGDATFFPVNSLHPNSQLWDDPDVFKSERFLKLERPGRQYIPNGDGPWVCIDVQYAQTEIIVLMASAIRKIKLGLTEQETTRPVLTITMRPESPLVLPTLPMG